MKDGPLENTDCPQRQAQAKSDRCHRCHQRVQSVKVAARRQFLQAATTCLGTLATGLYMTPLVRSLSPSSMEQQGQAPMVVDITHLAEGESIIVHWLDQPIWIVRRSLAMLGALASLNDRLKDPYSDDLDQQPPYVLTHRLYRSIRPNISVLVGQCTHLGCIPTQVFECAPQPFDQDWKGGYFCPCHRSRFDLAGRVYQQGPALTNLVVPPHHYRDAHTLVIGQAPLLQRTSARFEEKE